MSILKQECKEHLSHYYNVGPKLDELFALQKGFASRFHNLDNISPEDRDKWTNIYLIALSDELAELRQEIRWKTWKQYPKDFKHDLVEGRFEIADMMCFLMDLALVWGMTAEDFYDYVKSKQMLNIKRQEDPKLGYVKKTGKKIDKKNIL